MDLLSRLFGRRAADPPDPWGPFRVLFEDDPHPYLALLGPREDGYGVVERVADLAPRPETRRWLLRFARQGDWRLHVVLVAAAPLSPRPRRYVRPLWGAFDMGSWASPQVAAALFGIDPRFVRRAKRRVRALCPIRPHPELYSEEELAADPDAAAWASAKNLSALLGLLENLPEQEAWVARMRRRPRVRERLELDDVEGDRLAVGFLERWRGALEHLGHEPPPLRLAARYRRGRDPALSLFRGILDAGLPRLRVGVHEDEWAVAVVTLRDGVFEVVAQAREEIEEADRRRYRALWAGPRPDRPPAWPDDVPFLPDFECRIEYPSGPYAFEAVWDASHPYRSEFRDRIQELAPQLAEPGRFRPALEDLLDSGSAPPLDEGTREAVQTVAVEVEKRLEERGRLPDGDPIRPAFWEAIHGIGLTAEARKRLWEFFQRLLARREEAGWTLEEVRSFGDPHGYHVAADLARDGQSATYMLALSCGRASWTLSPLDRSVRDAAGGVGAP